MYFPPVTIIILYYSYCASQVQQHELVNICGVKCCNLGSDLQIMKYCLTGQIRGGVSLSLSLVLQLLTLPMCIYYPLSANNLVSQ